MSGFEFGGGDIVTLTLGGKTVQGEVAGKVLSPGGNFKWLIAVEGVDSPLLKETYELTLLRSFNLEE